MILILLLSLVSTVKSDLSHVNFFQYENVTIPDVEKICSSYQNVSVSEKCFEHLEIVCANTTLLWTIFDASEKFPYTGMSYSSRINYGNFDQCMSVDHSYNGGRILGEYCATGLAIPDFNDLNNIGNYYILAVCRPEGCSAADYNAIMKNLLSLPEDFQGLFIDGLCQTKETNSKYTAGDISVLTIFGVVIALMVVSTLYELYLEKIKQDSAHPLCQAFSVLSNGRKLLHISKHSTSKEQIEVFHGIRVISMMWVVAGHSYSMFSNTPVTNANDVDVWSSKLSSFHMTAAPLSVDTFFFMSGFLFAFQYFKGKMRSFMEQIISIPHMIVHRYLRLTPAVLMIYLVSITFFSHLGSGPVWNALADGLASTCKTHWWHFFLYIQNYNADSDMCLLQTWYLSADMQLFLVSPIIIIPLSLLLQGFGFKFSMIALIILNIVFTIMPITISLVINDTKSGYGSHPRLVVYFIGIALGFFMRQKIDKPFLYITKESVRQRINLITWLVVIFGMLAIVMCYQDQVVNHGFDSVKLLQYLRPAWCIALSWITYSCYHGQGGFVSWILCRPSFQVLGRLTYCIYLVHFSVIVYGLGTTRTKSFFTEYNAFYKFCGDYVVSVIIALFWTLAFESPLIVIEKYLLRGGRRSRDEQPLKNGGIEEGSHRATGKR